MERLLGALARATPLPYKESAFHLAGGQILLIYLGLIVMIFTQPVSAFTVDVHTVEKAAVAATALWAETMPTEHAAE